MICRPAGLPTHHRRPLAAFACALFATASAASEAAAICASEPDDQRRLRCYDTVFAPLDALTAARPVRLMTGTAKVNAEPELGRAGSIMAKTWELAPSDKRESFVVRTYLPNFLLPVHYTSRINRAPHSPTQPVSPSHPDYRQIEAKLQISLRAKVAENLLLPGADLWLAYTQRSLWQVWDSADSSPFRSTDYQPEAIYVIPVPPQFGQLPLGWNIRMLQIGLAHQSNGQDAPLSRSWNRIYVGAGLERGDFGVQLRAHHRLPEKTKDDNPDLTDFIGQGELSMTWLPGPATVNLTWRPNLKSVSRGSIQLDWTHPVFANQPMGLRWYAQLFSGYGETLLDYNHRQTSLGLGLTLFHF
ncbi:MAG: phospholipase [Betaproteobacteria bacterium HGW-Betaproteobacteria-10]|nr:MAG: phospholipase [Betaproteobacteria bacterium HGW-Betaproteobacteria-10]